MVRKTKGSKIQLIQIAAFTAVAAVILFFWIGNRSIGNNEADRAGVNLPKSDGTGDTMVQGRIKTPLVIDYKEMGKTNDLTAMMEQRKKSLSMDKSLDFIVRSDETFTVGEITVSMKEILKKALLKHQGVFEEKIQNSGEVIPETIKEFGIVVIQPGDNLWNIHFRILQEYYETRGITLAGTADEPLDCGTSSGVGKLLKFSESMVTIYDLINGEIDTEINLLEPLSKIVVYNMGEIFSLLEEINYENVDMIRFDGETIWIHADKASTGKNTSRLRPAVRA